MALAAVAATPARVQRHIPQHMRSYPTAEAVRVQKLRAKMRDMHIKLMQEHKVRMQQMHDLRARSVSWEAYRRSGRPVKK